MYDRICLFGAGGHGKTVAAQMKSRLCGIELRFCDQHKLRGSLVCDVEVSFNNLRELSDFRLIVTIGDNFLRSKFQNNAESEGIELGYFVADKDLYFTESLGIGSVVLAGAIVNCAAQIGKGVIINTGAIVEHDCIIGDFSHIAPGSVIAGGATIGVHVFVGAGANISNGISVADHAIIGAGTTVVEDITEAGVYVGSPARLVRRI